ncbi:MAG: hypothetical protein HC869_27400 [Rhodospirillales bacterium]|nr:hypothetical protein [Rhodospirillales bacterium]
MIEQLIMSLAVNACTLGMASATRPMIETAMNRIEPSSVVSGNELEGWQRPTPRGPASFSG